jgi:hypothetical protein
MKRLTLFTSVILCGLAATLAHAQCDAYFAFDGNLTDASGNGYDGQMIGEQGAKAVPQFVPGRSGQALALDGTSAMRAFVDLHYDRCPQVTFTAWMKFDSPMQRGTQYLLSTGSGSGPGLRVSGSNLGLSGPANGLIQRNAVRPDAGWMFVAGVYDFATGEYSLHWRNRSVSGRLRDISRAPEEAVWIGAFNDGLASAASNIVIDELHFFGKVLDADEIRTIQTDGGRSLLSAEFGATAAASSEASPDLASLSALAAATSADLAMTYDSCSSPADCGVAGDACFDISIPAAGTEGAMCTHGCAGDGQCPAANGFAGVCHALVGNTRLCHQRCDMNSDCGSGSECATITLADGVLDAICVPNGVDEVPAGDGSALMRNLPSSVTASSDRLAANAALTGPLAEIIENTARLSGLLSMAEDTRPAGATYGTCESPGDCTIDGDQCFDISVPATGTEGAMCTSLCSSDSQCPAAGGFTGKCHTETSQASLCYQRCDVADDCAAGSTCVAVTMAGGILDGLCFPDNAR